MSYPTQSDVPYVHPGALNANTFDEHNEAVCVTAPTFVLRAFIKILCVFAALKFDVYLTLTYISLKVNIMGKSQHCQQMQGSCARKNSIFLTTLASLIAND
jgi:hypothetical protein